MIPVKVEAGKIVMLDGAPLPRMLQGAIGDLVMSASSILNSDVAAALSQSGSVKLGGGGTIYATVSAKGIPPELRSSAKSFDEIVRTNSPIVQSQMDLRFVEVQLLEPLVLRLRGSKPAKLEPTHFISVPPV